MATIEMKNETTLAAVAAHPEDNPHYYVFAVIVDATEPTKYGKDSNYVTRLKVIDLSLNHKATIKGTDLKFFKFCTVNIYSETPDSAPKVEFIGDIIRLRRFKFSITDAKGELHAVEKTKFSNWIIYSGLREDKDFKPLCYKSIFQKNVNRQTTEYEKGRIMDLREWSHEYFSKYSLRYIIWWNDFTPASDKKNIDKHHAATQKDVDLILKVTEANAKENTMKFIDSDDNVFQLALDSHPKQSKNQIVKLRCVDVHTEVAKGKEVRNIKLTPHSSCLFLRDYFRDSNAFELDKKKFPLKNYYVLEYPAKQKGYATSIKKAYEKWKPTQISRLNNILAKDSESHINDKFVVEGKIEGYASTEPKEIIKKQFKKTLPVVSLNEKGASKYQIIYHIIPTLIDDSKDSLDFHIITSEENYYIFDAWKILPQTKDNAGWNEIKQGKLKEFSEKLDEIADKGLKVKFVLQLLMTESNRPFFKVIDTMFVDF